MCPGEIAARSIMTPSTGAGWEEKLLGYLCQPELAGREWADWIVRLRGYRFRKIGNQVLFDCMKNIPAGRDALVAALLPERLVRAGFPDFDLEAYRQAAPRSEEEIRRLQEDALAEISSDRNKNFLEERCWESGIFWGWTKKNCRTA